MMEIGRFIKAHNPARAAPFVDELYDRCEALGENPRAFPLLDSHKDQGIRRRVYGNYLIFYRVKDAIVEVLHVLHGAQDYGQILLGDE